MGRISTDTFIERQPMGTREHSDPLSRLNHAGVRAPVFFLSGEAPLNKKTYGALWGAQDELFVNNCLEEESGDVADIIDLEAAIRFLRKENIS